MKYVSRHVRQKKKECRIYGLALASVNIIQLFPAIDICLHDPLSVSLARELEHMHIYKRPFLTKYVYFVY